ncbi:MAG TPA: DUF885 domain-containing protein [Candidatus Limnocylindrales bacterium]
MPASLADLTLSRPTSAAGPGQLDDQLFDLIEGRFRRLMEDNPVLATYLGIHTEDGRLGDASRDALLDELAKDKAHLAAVEAIDPTGLSDEAAFERELELHNLRLSIFETESVRTWERRSYAMDAAGDALFSLFARDFAPLAERLVSITERLDALPAFLDQHRTRATVPQVRLWQQLEIESAGELPGFIDQLTAAGSVLSASDRDRLGRAGERATEAIADYATWLRGTLDNGSDDWALGRDALSELVNRRAFDGLDVDAILAIGEEQLAEHKAARVAAAREIDPDASEASVVDRVKSDHPATFEEALDAYREAMVRARAHLIDTGLVTVPPDEHLDVMATPEYMRNTIPFAAYFEPPKFDQRPSGIYIVTPSVDHDPGAMREHNRSSISNTSIHEAYPGHHLQLSVAVRHPSLSRLLAAAPEFTEGWGMYSEQLMREHAFDDGPAFRLTLHTDAIWRACRIVLDVKMHRGEISVDDAIRFLVEHTSFEEPNARAEVHRYTYTPTYQMSYLLGKVLILALREDERRRLGDRFDLRTFHDALLRHGSIPISFHRRLLAGGNGQAA